MRRDPSSSDGFGGAWPEVSTAGSPGPGCCMASWTPAWSRRTVVVPTRCCRPKSLCSDGRRRSASTTATCWPAWARAMARLAATVDLPWAADGGADGDFQLLGGLHRAVEELPQAREPDAEHQPQQQTEGDVEPGPRSDRGGRREGGLDQADPERRTALEPWNGGDERPGHAVGEALGPGRVDVLDGQVDEQRVGDRFGVHPRLELARRERLRVQAEGGLGGGAGLEDLRERLDQLLREECPLVGGGGAATRVGLADHEQLGGSLVDGDGGLRRDERGGGAEQARKHDQPDSLADDPEVVTQFHAEGQTPDWRKTAGTVRRRTNRSMESDQFST